MRKLRDPSHVRNYSEAEWRELLTGAGLGIVAVRVAERRIELEPWLARTGCVGQDAARVRELVAERVEDGWMRLERIAIRGEKA